MIVTQRLEDDQYREELRTILGEEGYRTAVIEQLLHEYKNDVFLLCVRWLDSVHGEEIAQEVFVRAWQSLLRYRGDSSIQTWLFGIAKNECRKFLRNRNRRRLLMEVWLSDVRERVHGEEPATPEEQVGEFQEENAEREKVAKLFACIKKLPDRDELLVRWHYVKDRSVTEISDFLDEKRDTVYKRLKRALQKLKECTNDGP